MSQAPGIAARSLVRRCATARSRRHFDELGEPVRARRRGRLPRGRLPQRGQGDPRGRRVGRGAGARRGASTELAGRRQDDRGEDRRAARDRLDPLRRQAEGEASRRASSRSRASRASGRSGAQAAPRRARRRRRSTSCAAAAEQGRLQGREGLRRRRPRRTCSRRSPPARTAAPRTRMLLSQGARRSREELVDGAARAPGGDPRGARGQRAAPGRHGARTSTSWPPSSDPAALVEGVRRAAADRRGLRPRARRARRRSPTPACRWTCGSCPRRRSATCSSTSPARAAQRGAAHRGGPARPARERVRHRRRRDRRLRGVHDRGGGLRAARACSTSRRSCARTAASSRPRARAKLPELIELGDIRGDLHMHTTPRTATQHDRGDGRGRAASAATSTWRSPTTRPRTGSATTCRPTSCCARSSEIRALPDADGITRARRHRDERAARRLARLRGRRARAARLGRREPAHLLPACREKEQTKRMMTAMEHPLVDVIGHPTGRLIERREAVRARPGRGDREGASRPAPSSRSTRTPTGAT